jgi:hypothetical protein
MKPHSKPGRGGEETGISQRRGEIELQRLRDAMAAVLAQEWGEYRPTVQTAFDALLREMEVQ